MKNDSSTINNHDTFRFGIPIDIIKGKNSKGEERMLFKGRAATDDKDHQGESLSTSGMDISQLKTINWNHGRTPDCIIGEPTKAVISKGNLDIEGELYSEMPHAISTYNLMKALQKRGKQLYFSVEGKVIQRGSEDKNHADYNKILKSRISAVAITPTPVNSNTFCELIQKGYTDINEWSFDEETEALVKATTSGDNEGTNNKLKKSEILEKIYDHNPGITIEKAKSVYSLIEKIANMATDKEIKDETISKAFEILDLASDSISKAAKDAEFKKEKEGKDDEEDEEEKEMVKKAKGHCDVMKSEKKEKEEIKKALIKKGYGEKVIEKAMKEDTETKEEKKDGITKSELADILKSQNESLAKSFGDQFTAIGTILKAVTEENSEIKKSLETSLGENKELKEKMTNIINTPNDRRSLISKSFSDRFGKEGEEGRVKEGKKFNINSQQDRLALRDKVTELSGINKGDGQYDIGLTKIASELEITKSLSPTSLNRLKAMDIEVVKQ